MARFALVDDDIASLQWLHTYLRRSGHQCVSTGSAGFDIRTVEHMCPDIAVVGLMMRHRCGFELCRTFRRHPTLHRVSVLVSSAVHDEEEREHALRQGADDFVVKPFRPVELGPKLERLYHLTQAANETDATTGLPAAERFKKSLSHHLARMEQVDLCCFEIHGLAQMTQRYGKEAHDVLLANAAESLRDAANHYEMGIETLGYLGGGFLAAMVPHVHTQTFCHRVQLHMAAKAPVHDIVAPLLVRSVRPVPSGAPTVMDTFAAMHALIDGVPLARHAQMFMDRRHRETCHAAAHSGGSTP